MFPDGDYVGGRHGRVHSLRCIPPTWKGLADAFRITVEWAIASGETTLDPTRIE